MHRLHCSTAREYDVLVSPGVLQADNPVLAQTLAGRRALVITDTVVHAQYGAALRTALRDCEIAVLDVDEQRKDIDAVLLICRLAQQLRLGRTDLLVAVGGGVICDLVAVAASLIRRGVPYVCVPTTLVADIDAAVGLKGGVNLDGVKNFLGCFSPPDAVVVDPTFLQTVPAVELSAGFAEVLKIALVRDASLFALVQDVGPGLVRSRFTSRGGREVLDSAIGQMLDELAKNPYEDQGYERLLDFGHTFSPLLEQESGFTLRHGEAVALDMVLSGAIAVTLGILQRPDYDELVAAVQSLGLPYRSELCTRATIQAGLVSAARHRGGRVNLVLPQKIGSATFVRAVQDVPGDVVAESLRLVRGLPGP